MENDQFKTDISFDELVAYTFNELSKEREREVEQLLEEDPIYSETVDGLLTYCERHQIQSAEELKLAFVQEQIAFETYLREKTLQKDNSPQQDQAKAQDSQQKKKSTIRIIRYLPAIAAALLLAAFGIWWLVQSTPKQPSDIAQRWHEAYPPDLLNSTMGGMNDIRVDSTQFYLTAITRKEPALMAQAIKYFQRVSTEDTTYLASQSYLGYAYFVEENYTLAIQAFENYLKNPLSKETRFRVEFDRCLALIGAGKEAEGVAGLRKISENEAHDYAFIAKEVLAEYSSKEG